MRMRYLGGGLGRMPSVRRTTRLMKPRGFLRPDISVSSACSVPMPPPPIMPPAGMICRTGPVRARGRVGPEALHAGLAAEAAAAAAERVGLVEEDDHAAVPDRELAQLAEQALHLEN